ncbi:metallophosphoesterase family protein [Bradyrhizobium sp. 149]|uniref:metallophosphoesterase family protein n=1 Tax=Bradyrhizobium sp. 149 TaxID=2782624 RepID=UPI001FF76578|nr:metallophosphoesterase family protein [Bradyrhizobium sp. 149]MCK1653461.1 metallophosphoesterase family protein [Bradyrhizobium sp. 149]
MAFRIGVISDTHGLLRPEVERCLASVSHIIHAGDIGAPGIVEDLRRIAPVTAIKGNVDKGDWAKCYAETETVRLAGACFHILHDLKELKANPAQRGIDVVISGHSHRVKIEAVGGILFLNPGSAGPRRFRLPITLATLDVDEGGGLRPTIHELDR